MLSHHTISRVHIISRVCHCWCWPWSLGWESVCQDSPVFPPFCHCPLWKDVATCSPHLKYVELCSPSQRAECLRKLFGILPHGKTVSSLSFIYSITYLHQYGLVDIYFTCLVLIQHYLCSIEHIFPALAIGISFSRLLCPSDMFIEWIIFFLAYLYSLALSDLLGSSCIFPAWVLEIILWHIFSYWKIVLKTKILPLDVFLFPN